MAAKTRGNRKPKPRERRPRQGYLSDDMAPPRIQEIDDAAEEYVTARDSRMAFGEQETKAADLLLALMHKHSLPAYEYDGKIVSLSKVEKIKVKKKKSVEDNGDEDSE